MNYRLVILLITLVFCIDTCAEQQTYQDCIGYKGEQCQWLGQYCRQSNNYLFGCDPNLNELLCVKQFGTLDGTISECIFDSFCHTIYDKHSIKCQDKLSKSGCLSITNPNELCKWEETQCKYLDQDEIINIKNIFHKLELNASVCSKIDGYLIIHNSLLWNILGYQPNLYQEAENLKKKEAGIKIEINNEYDQSAILQDNYVDSFGIFHWYQGTTQAMISNGELNDFKRYGCIAQEILTENRYYQLFSLTGILRGVNHVYCKYLNMHPSNPVLTIFVDSECLTITEQQLQDQNYIQQYKIECQSLSRIACQKYYNKNQLCQIFPYHEYQCQNVQIISEINDCDPYTLEATHSICASAKNEACYLDISSMNGQCTNICVNYLNQNDCIQDSQCQWLGQNLNNITQTDNLNFIVCAPLNGCNQLGLNQYYCTRMATNCIWDELSNRCKSIDLIESYKCIDCNQIFCCSSVIRYDQFCIWFDNSCINVKDQYLYSHFLSFPENTLMNYNLCVNQIGQYNYYNYQTRKCSKQNIDLYNPCLINNQNIQDDLYIECNNPPNNSINQEGCLALINSNTKWDIFKQKCFQVMNINKPCDEFKLVNPNICKHATINENYICLYDEETLSCISKLKQNIELKCDTQGINEEECLNLNNQLCAWRSNKCNYLKINEIQQRTCNELFKVSASVCKYSINSQQYCQYDFDSNGCTVFIEPMIECNQYSNRYACQSANFQCYFDNILNQCLDSTKYLNVLLCDTEWISKLTCINITTPGQRCIWNSKCELYKIHFYSDCSTPEVQKGNPNLCDTLQSNIYLTLVDYQYCEVINNQCTHSIITITDNDCGYNRKMNLFRCMGYTQKLCYFDNYKCTRLIGPTNYQNILLNKLTCDQSNMQLCTLIQTPGQSCYRSNFRKCTEVEESFKNSCWNIIQLNKNDYSPNICSRAFDSCFYDKNTQQCAIPDQNMIFDCSTTGISSQACRLQTKGACIFQNKFCQLFNNPFIECESRNKKACTMGFWRCYWEQKTQYCISYNNNCPNTYQNGESFLFCSNSDGYCYAGPDGCINDFNDSLPCWVSLNQQLCNQQSTFCQWIDNNCINKSYKCEDATSLEQCILHRSLNCVYDNGKCFEIINFQIYNCDDFEKTTQLFCRNYYPQCMYSQEKYICQKIYFLGDGIQRDLELSTQGCSGIARNYYNCILQTASSCSFFDNYGFKFCTSSYVSNEKCEWYDTTNPYSISLCQEKPNCRFKMTVEGKPFCYTYPLQCENLDSIMCLLDIPNANCFLNNLTNTCQTFILTPTCYDIINIQVNYHLCLQASLNSFIPCYYQTQTKMCKMDENNGDIQQQLLNCISQQNGVYFFNLQYQFCQNKYDINQNYDDIYYCYQMNQISCLSIINDLSCLWVDQKCQENQIIYNSLECERRNYNSCLIGDVSCIWDKDQNKCLNELDSKLCKNCEYSEYYCIQIDQLWDGKNCYQFTSNLPISFHQCEKLGLNQNLCLNNTVNLYCFWDGIKCRDANLKLQQCTDQVSQSTCLNIQTPYQACVWQNNICVQKYDSTDCNDFLKLQSCRDAQILCQFNLGQNQCQSISGKIENCQNTLSRGACQLVEQEICTWSDNQCQLWPRAKYSCENILNQWGCLNTTMFCKWEQKCENIETADYSQPKMDCLQIPYNFNKVSCQKFSIGPCNYDETIGRCNINLTSDLLDNLEFNKKNRFYQTKPNNDCTNLTTLSACISSKKSYCQWQQNQCLNCQKDSNCTEDCHNNNLLQCLQTNNLFCAWRNNSCVEWIQSSNIILGQLNLVSQKICTIQDLDVKYDIQLNSCLPLDYENDDCYTPGLSQYACLKIIKYQCKYEDGQCKVFKFYPKPQCKQFQNVTQKVCQMIPKLSCKFNSNNNQCVDVEDQDDCDAIGLSLEGCTKIKKSPCFWNDQTQSCNFYKLEKGINQCNLQIKTNSLSCQLLNYHNDVCSYNFEQRTCHQNYNKFSKCDYPGLNRKACLSLQLEPCKFENDKCLKLQNLNVGCLSLQNVNELACQMSLKDNCAYNPILQNCFVTSTQLPCQYPGLNINSCKNQNNCVWSYDDKKCQCQSITLKQKCNLSLQSCNLNEECIFDFDLNVCRTKTCLDLKNCQGRVNQLQCYLDSNEICQSAQTCEDIINLNNSHTCNEFVFSNANCIQILNNCVGHKNLKLICLNSDCNNSYCIMDNFQCRPIECTDLKENECYHKQNCSFINNKCIFIQSCSEINDQNICEQTQVNNFQCLWEMKEIFDQSKYCTNSYCSIYSNIPSLCNGNEINEYSCKMDKFYQCRMCEEITDPCECRDNDNNFCYFKDGMCVSILCSEFHQEMDCMSSNKCYWSIQDFTCRKFCKYIIVQEECEALNYECNWNPYKYKCEQGKAIDTDLSVHFQVQTIFSIILEISLVAILI